MAEEEAVEFDFCIPVTPFGIIVLIVGIIASVITLIVTVHTIKRFKQNKKIVLHSKFIYASTLILFSISGVGYTMLHSTGLTSSLCALGYVEDISGSFAVLGYTLGLVLLYMSLTLRLKNVFKESAFRLSSLLLWFLLSGTVIQIIPIPIFLYFFIIWHPLAFVFFSIWIILYNVYSFILLFVFCCKVYQFMKYTHKDIMVPVIIKYCILTSFSILTSFVVSMLYLIIGIGVFREASPMMNELSLGLIPIDQAMNSICLMLHFSFSKKIYKFLCKKCHQCCFNMVETDQSKLNVDSVTDRDQTKTKESETSGDAQDSNMEMI